MKYETFNHIAWSIWLAYLQVPPKKARRLLAQLPKNGGWPKKIPENFRLSSTQKKGIEDPNWDLVAQNLIWANENGHYLICPDNPLYPQQLLDDEQYPNFIFAKGNIDLLKQPQIAVVGSRQASLYGLESTKKICRHLSDSNVVITSGMAIGIDAIAHQCALNSHTPTIAVLGMDIETIYPKQHKKLYHDILKNGLIISAVPLNMHYHPRIFPERNRIISALSQAVIVVEAYKNSGAMHTVNHALDQDRAVYALPGRIDQPQAQGCNHLIQSGAHILTHEHDISISNLFIRERDKPLIIEDS